MNILYLHTHDTGRYIQPYGYAVPTPHLQQFASESLMFRQAYSAAPTCSPSRAAMLTGQMPHNNGMCGLAHRGFCITNPKHHLAFYLSEYNFETVLCGIQHETDKAEKLGYKKILGSQNYSMGKCNADWRSFDIQNAQHVADYIKDTKDKNFFVSFGMFNTHRKFPELSDDESYNYVMPLPPVCDNPENRKDMAEFIKSAETMDECVGIVLGTLKASGHDKDTVVMFTTDHGPAFPEMKCTLYDTGTGVSLIIHYPDSVMNGKVSDALVSHLDVFPTLCEMAEVSLPDWLQGKSLMPLINNQADSIHSEIFSENSYHVAYEPKRSVRTEKYKYIKRFSSYPYSMPSNTDDSPDKLRRLSEGYYNRQIEKELLFDLENDPYERVNLASMTEYKQLKIQMSEKLERWMKKTQDPLLYGTMAFPEGALVNYPESNSPSEKIFIKDISELK